MKLLTIAKILLILILPFLIFLLVFNFAGLNDSFFKSEFSKYGINDKFIDAESMHQKVIDFIEGKSNELPADFNDREKSHLMDVRKVTSSLTITLYMMVVLFIILLIASVFTLKVNSCIINFVGKVLLWGGMLTVAAAALLFLSVTLDFGSAFDSMHKTLFQTGTYVFDPAKEMIVNLYPEQLFMDLGIRISVWIFALSVIIILIGLYLIFKTKNSKK